MIRQRRRRAGGVEGTDRQFVRAAEVTAGEFGVVFLQRDQAELDVGFEKVRALREEPDEFVVGDLRLAGLHHRLDLLDVLPPLPAAAGVDEFPGRTPGRVAAGDRELFPAQPAPSAWTLSAV